jgi:ABC-type branched-subunit amino acid transport system ATPase component
VTQALLEARALSVGYTEAIDILRGLDLAVPAGSITAVIGSNGAGKSTLLKCLFGLLPARRGDVLLDGVSIRGWSPDRRKAAGISYLPQHHSTFPQLTVEQNLKLGGWLLRGDRARLQQRLAEVYRLFPALAERRQTRATALSGGQLRMLSVAKEMVVPPRLLLVDEPSVGMAPKVAAELYGLVAGLPAAGVTVLLVDQNLADAVAVADRVYLLGEGRVVRSGEAACFRSHLDEVVAEMLRGPATPADR